MATTTPDSLRSPNPGDPYNLVADLAIMQTDNQAAFVRRANMYVGTSAQRTAFTTATNGVHWQDTNGTQLEYVRKSGAWVPAVPILRGSVTINIAAANTGYSSTISFPAGTFTSAPTIQLTSGSTAGGGTTLNMWVSGTPTLTSATISVTRSVALSSQVIHWVAVGV